MGKSLLVIVNLYTCAAKPQSGQVSKPNHSTCSTAMSIKGVSMQNMAGASYSYKASPSLTLSKFRPLCLKERPDAHAQAQNISLDFP